MVSYVLKLILHVHTAIFKMDNQQRPTVSHRQLCSILCGSLGGRGVWGRTNTHLCTAESFCCPLETIATLLIGYTPIQDRKLKKKECFKLDSDKWTPSAPRLGQEKMRCLPGGSIPVLRCPECPGGIASILWDTSSSLGVSLLRLPGAPFSTVFSQQVPSPWQSGPLLHRCFR